jgi:hypothetical protein
MALESHCLAEHKEIRALIRGLHDQLDEATLLRNAQPSIQLLLRLGGVLKHHFGEEKEGLYGRLAASSDPLIRATALMAQDDLCGLEPRVVHFIRYWTSAGRIQEDVYGYLRDAGNLFRAIGRRIGQEERELLPMLATVV